MCFFKQKTAYEMRISDWSSDVCSSDLISAQPRQLRRRPQGQGQPLVVRLLLDEHPAALDEGAEVHLLLPALQLAGFDLREVEQIVDEAQQVLPGAVDVLRVLRSEERRVGKEGGSTCSTRGSTAN